MGGTLKAPFGDLCPYDWGQMWHPRYMAETKWARWLYRLTGDLTERGVARRVGVTHTTVQRWVRSGVPPSRAYELCVRFGGDPFEVMLLIGRIQPEDVQMLNWAAIVQYAPAAVLTAELHARTVEATTADPDVDPRKRSVGV